MHGEINVNYIMEDAKRQAAIIKHLQASRAPDEEKLKHNRKINARTHGVIWKYQHHHLTQREASALIHDLEHQLR